MVLQDFYRDLHGFNVLFQKVLYGICLTNMIQKSHPPESKHPPFYGPKYV